MPQPEFNPHAVAMFHKALAAADEEEDRAQSRTAPAEPRPSRAENLRAGKAARIRAPKMLKRKPNNRFDIRLPPEDVLRIRIVAANHDHSVRDVVIWLLQRGIASLPKNALGDN